MLKSVILETATTTTATKTINKNKASKICKKHATKTSGNSSRHRRSSSRSNLSKINTQNKANWVSKRKEENERGEGEGGGRGGVEVVEGEAKRRRSEGG